MKLIKKFLTASLPVALVGVVTPTIASCSCHKNSYTYEYKDHINCKDKDDGDYHKRKDIASAAKQKAYQEQNPYSVDPSTLNAILTIEDFSERFVFNELIASIVITKNVDMNLKGDTWDYTITEGSAKLSCDLDSQLLTGAVTYGKNADNKIVLKIGDTEFVSYAFYNCIPQ